MLIPLLLSVAACGRSEQPTPTPAPTAAVATEAPAATHAAALTITPAVTRAATATAVPPGPASGPEPTPAARGTVPVVPVPVLAAVSWEPDAPKLPYLLFNEKFVEGVTVDVGLDMTDIDGVFWHIFSRLPDEVIVYPSENYYYFIFYADGMQYWGNIRLAAGRRERGVLSFAYFEFTEFPSVPGRGKSYSKYFTDSDGIRLTEIDPFTWDVRYNRRTVRFHLNKLRQDPPESFQLAENEAFIERTLDESGLRFFLLFNTDANYFSWVLNEEEGVPERFEAIADDVLLGTRSGFAFWVDGEHQDRKVLATIRSISVTRNDYYDGPFDQLADNYVDESKVSEWMIRAYPSLEGRIDKYGYYMDSERASRVAISAYGTYYTRADILSFIERAKGTDDPLHFISRGGTPLPTTPTPEPTPSE